MKKLSLSLLLVLSASILFAQDPPGLSAASKRYREYRMTNSVPPYNAAMIRKMIAGLKYDNEDSKHVSAKVFEGMSVKDKFTYSMLHGEDMNQNCNGMPGIIDEEKKVFAQVPSAFDFEESGWSKRQTAFLHQHKAEVVAMMRSSIRAHHRVGLNYKETIVELDANALIPDLVAVYNRDHKDQDILTVLMLLMKDGKYKPFMESATYKKLYGDSANWQSYLDATPANQKLTVSRALAFYKTTK